MNILAEKDLKSSPKMQTEESIVNVDDKKDNAFYCEKCTFQTHYYSRLVSHSVVHSLDRPYACEYCHYAAKRKSDLRKHLIHKHKLSETKKVTKGPPTSRQPNGLSNSSQQKSKSLPVTYTLSPEQEVAQSPESIHDDTEEISIHSGSNTPTIKVELNDDSEVTSIRQFEYTIPLPTASSFTDTGPVTVSLPHILFPHQRMTTAFTPTITPISSHATVNPHRISYSPISSSEVQGLVASKTSPTNQGFSPLTLSGPLNMKDVSTLTNQCFFCQHCNILFFDNGLYVMHMGLHHSENPWQCNLCGQAHKDVYSFTLHFITHHKQ